MARGAGEPGEGVGCGASRPTEGEEGAKVQTGQEERWGGRGEESVSRRGE